MRQKEKALHKAGLGDGGGVSGAHTNLRSSERKGCGAKFHDFLSSNKRTRVVVESGGKLCGGAPPPSEGSSCMWRQGCYTKQQEAGSISSGGNG